MGPSEAIRSWLLQMRWVHLYASEAPPRTLKGQSEAIGSSSQRCNGPILGRRKRLPENEWAKPKPSAAAAENAIGPSFESEATPRRFLGPSEAIGSRLLKMQWARPYASEVPPET